MTYHHGNLERALVGEALAQVRALGGDAVSARQVAQAVGVSPSAAYAHFPDKTALMAAVAGEGLAALDSRLLAVAASMTGDDDGAAIARFRATNEAYLAFALDEPHLFRHTFGYACPPVDGSSTLDEAPGYTRSVAYQVLCQGLDELEGRGLLRPGSRTGLDLAAWTMVHGLACLVLDGFLPPEAGHTLLDTLTRLVLRPEIFSAQPG